LRRVVEPEPVVSFQRLQQSVVLRREFTSPDQVLNFAEFCILWKLVEEFALDFLQRTVAAIAVQVAKAGDADACKVF